MNAYVALAAGEPVRRLAADILVMTDDARRLTTEDLSARQRKGLTQRITGMTAQLPLSAKAAREDAPALPVFPKDAVASLQAALAAENPDGLMAPLEHLNKLYPFPTIGLLPPDARADTAAKRIHQKYCAVCHDKPNLDVQRPAWNLFEMASGMTPDVLAARLVIGIKGEHLMALENPLTDSEISALIAYYQGK